LDIKIIVINIANSQKAEFWRRGRAKGQGFGLAVVKRMTEGLGGTVSFESQAGKGTTFTVRLPPQRAKR